MMNLAAFARFRSRIARRAKGVLGWMLFRSGLYRRWIHRCGVVVLFHRIDDGIGDNPITVTTAHFEAFLKFFAEYFDIVPFGEFVDRLHGGRPVGGLLAITFDDGYRDNHRIAAPLLQQFSLPACFFVTTGFIETSHIPPWDEDCGIESEWMTWDEVRELHEMGFEIGAHTCHHVDLGQTHGEDALREIQGSVWRLERELDESISLFSYPFGRSDQITEANREIIRNLGLRCAPSAFGGQVADGDSPYAFRRQPISTWHLNPWQFGFEHLVACIRTQPRSVAPHPLVQENGSPRVRS